MHERKERPKLHLNILRRAETKKAKIWCPRCFIVTFSQTISLRKAHNYNLHHWETYAIRIIKLVVASLWILLITQQSFFMETTAEYIGLCVKCLWNHINARHVIKWHLKTLLYLPAPRALQPAMRPTAEASLSATANIICSCPLSIKTTLSTATK